MCMSYKVYVAFTRKAETKLVKFTQNETQAQKIYKRLNSVLR